MRLAGIIVVAVLVSGVAPATRPASSTRPILANDQAAMRQELQSLRAELSRLKVELAKVRLENSSLRDQLTAKTATSKAKPSSKRKPIDPEEVERMQEVGGDRIPAR